MEFAKLKPDKSIQPYCWNHQAHIATGPHFKLFLGQNCLDHSQILLKQVDRSLISDPVSFENLLAEIKTFQKKTLQNCVKYIDLAKSQDSFYFIQSFCNGGDLRHFIQKTGKIDENEAIKVIQAIIKGFQSLAKEGLIHGNFKPENVQIHNKNFLLNDYSLIKYYECFLQEKLEKKEENTENFFYFSPQKLANLQYKPTVKNDIWTLGIIYYEMLYGILPWNAKNKPEYLQTLRKIPIRFPFNLPISEKSKDFLKGCLQIEENSRISLEEILRHPLINGEISQEISKENQLKSGNLTPKNMRILQELQLIIAKQSLNLEKLFQSFDRTKDRSLDLHEFMKLIIVIQPKLEMNDVHEVFQRFDENRDGSISFSEFKKLICDTDYRENNDDEQLADFRGDKLLDHIVNIIIENNLDLEKMISQFDVTGDKMLKFGEFLPIIRAFDSGITDQDGRFVFKKFDKNGDSELTYQEFKEILQLEIEKREKKPKIVKKNKQIVFSIAEKILEDLKKVIILNKLDTKMVFKSFDKSGDSMLDFTEFKGLVAIINARNTDTDLKELFKLFDFNNDGNINFEEFQKALLEEK